MNYEFRVWDISKKCWIYFNLIDAIIGNVKAQVGNTLYLENYCIFTGIHDKNGCRIFVGDILNVPSIKDYPNCVVKMGTYQENEGAPNGFYVEWPNGIQGYLNTSWESKSGGVIVGNIYENPELIFKKEG